MQILAAGGAKVVLFTAPYYDPPVESSSGAPYPENNPARVDEWNRIVREVAAEHPGEVTLIDLNRLLDPDGHFQSVVDGVTVRWPDGIHFSKDGGEWLQPPILPTVAPPGPVQRRSGRPPRDRADAGTTPRTGGPTSARRPPAGSGCSPSTACGPSPCSSSWATTSGWAGSRAASSASTSSTSCPATSSPACCWASGRGGPASSSRPSGCAGPGACCPPCWWCWWW